MFGLTLSHVPYSKSPLLAKAARSGAIIFSTRKDLSLDCATLPKVIRPPDHRLLSDLAAYDPEVSNLTLALREVILEEAPDAIESIVKGYALAIGF